jgi:hypothetical protein
MTRKFKALGFVFVAVAAISAASGSAQASELHVTHQGSAVITAEQLASPGQHVLTTNSGTAVCSSATFEGSVASAGTQITAQEIQMTATYSVGCQAFGLAATVQMNGCKYTITNKVGQSTTAKTATVDITGCSSPAKLNSGFSSCIVTVGNQASLGGHLVLQNNNSPSEDVTAKITVTGIQYQNHGPLCVGAATEQRSDGTYNGEATVRAFRGTQTEEITQHEIQFKRLKHDSFQVGLVAT